MFKDMYGKEHKTKSDASFANVSYSLMEVLTEQMNLTVEPAATLLIQIRDDQVFRAILMQYCQLSEINAIIQASKEPV